MTSAGSKVIAPMEAPSTEIYLVVDNARSQALTRAWDQFDDPAVATVDLFYRASTDVALVAVRLRGGRDRGRWIGQVVASGIAVIDPARMGEGDRRAFFATYLQSYEVIARQCAGVASAMSALRFRTAQKNARGTGPAAAITDGDRSGVVQPIEAARGRLGSEPPAAPTRAPTDRDKTDRAPTPIPEARRDTSLGLGVLRRPASDDPPPRRDQMLTEPNPLPPPPPVGGGDDDHDGVVRDRDGADRDSGERRARLVTEEPPTRRDRLRSPQPGDPVPPAVSAAGDAPAVMVRFLRGGQWSPARLRSLSVRGAYLVTSAPPRVGDEVHVALDFAELTALMRGAVYHVTTARDAVSTGSSGFAVRFPVEQTPSRARLIELLQRARAQGVVIRPPPARHSVRFPVRWPVQLKGEASGHADALDVSTGGMFVSPPTPLRSSTVTAVIPIDVGDPPIEVRARVARSVTPIDAIARGLSPGYGLEILEMSEGDRVRWQRFLSRVERRSGRSVLVGASPARLEAIARALADAGYAVSSSADPGTLIRLADTGPLPDVAVIDDSLIELGVSSTWLEQMFTTRQVPCITVRGEPLRARMVVDRLLAVAAS